MSNLARYQRGFGRRKPGPWARVDWSHPLAEGLAGCFLLNESGGDVIRGIASSGGVGTVYSDVLWSAGPSSGSCLNFNSTLGSGEVFGLPVCVTAAPLTLACRFNIATNPNGYTGLIDSGNLGTGTVGYTLALDPANHCFIAVNSGFQNTATTVVDGAWHFAVGTMDAARSLNMYLDGQLSNGAGAGSPGYSPQGGMTLGSGYYAGAFNMKGYLDAAYIWNRCLSPAEVAWLYAEPFAFLAQPAPRRSFFGPGGTAAYSLGGTVGTFALTGQAATLNKGLGLPGAAGAFTLSGQSAALSAARPLSASAGSFLLTGQPATTDWLRKLAGSAGAFVITGQNATPATGKGISGAAGSFTLTGKVLAALKALGLAGSAGAFMLAGYAADLLANLVVSNLVIADLVHETTTTTGTGALTLAGVALPARRAFALVLAAGDSCRAAITHRTAAEWEITTLTMQPGGTLARGVPIKSSNGNALVNFSAGVKDVLLAVPAVDLGGLITVGGYVVVVR